MRSSQSRSLANAGVQSAPAAQQNAQQRNAQLLQMLAGLQYEASRGYSNVQVWACSYKPLSPCV